MRTWRRMLRRLGTGGLVGLAMFAVAGILTVWMQAIGSESARLNQQLQGLSKALQLQHRERKGNAGAVRGSDELLSALPSPTQVADDLGEIFKAGREHKVALPKGEYQYSVDPATKLVTYSATFSVREPYRVIKQFVAEVLDRLPQAALDDLRLERHDAAAQQIDARLRFLLFYRLP